MSIPALFHSAVPWELESYIRGQQRNATEQPLNAFAPEGVKRIAGQLLEEVAEGRHAAESQGVPPQVGEHVRSWTYALHAYCHKYNEPAPDELLQLTFAALECREFAPAPAVSRALNLPDDIRNMPAFSEAAAIDGEADAAGQPLSVNALSKRMGIMRDTVRRWREHPRYQSRRALAEMAARHWNP